MSEIERELLGTVRESLHNSKTFDKPLCLKKLGKIEHRKAIFSPGIVQYNEQGAVLEYHYAVIKGDRIPARLTLREAQDAIDRETNFSVCFP